ncbi:hypothetical protein BJQ94_17360 [Cryobacterium sp. SO2]|uniref:SCO7613 C-terminal domain-containing membrane protein n=1 Tax=Cryobacterium sp. SO2 TaxID=1897060 RepID=UPI00223E5101|nr:hypothetical protein [Cryobacterium sp. SO2]WEO77096.1 hypothetical protein BJQ94_17360 [Cryobacterium sp. SO2]
MSPSSSIRDFAQYAGRFLWPRSTADLTDTTLCPACRTALTSVVCPACGLDLRHPAARDLLAASTDAATALDKRVQLIGQIRYEVAEAQASAQSMARRHAEEQVAAHAKAAEQAARAAEIQRQELAQRAAAHAEGQRAAALAAAAAAAQTRLALASAAPVSSTVAAPPLAPAADVPTGPAPHKRSSVQIVLLLVGVTLVSIAAIVFVTVAFIFTGLAFRAGVVAVLTLGTLITAALLRRKGLVATAEGIGALAVVLVLLDAWALRQLNLFGLGEGDGLLYWGAALSVCTVLFLGWHAASSLRVASVAGFAAAVPAAGLLAAGIAADAAPITRVFVAGAAAAAGALLHRFTLPGSAGMWPSLNRRAERGALLTIAGLALLTAASLAGVVVPGTDWAPLLSFGVVAVLAAAHALTVLSRPRPGIASRVAAHTFVALAALAGVLGVLVSTGRSDTLTLVVAVPLPVAVLIALGFEWAWRRTPVGAVRWTILTGGLTAVVLMGLLGIVVAVAAAAPLVQALIGASTDPIARPVSESVAALVTLAGVAVLVAVIWRVGGVLAARRHVLVWFGVVLVLLAVPFTQWLWLILPLYLLLGAVALAAVILARSARPQLGPFRPQLLTLFALAEALGYALGWSDSSSWWLGSLSAVLALVIVRLLLNRDSAAGGRGALLSGAVVLTLIGVAVAPRALTLAAPPTDAVLRVHVLIALAVATGVLALFVAQSRVGGLVPLERRWLFWTLLAPTLYVVAAPTGRLLEALPSAERTTVALLAPAAGILATALVAVAALLWTLLPSPQPDRAPLRWERLTGALLVAPALLALAVNLVLVTDAPATVSVLAAPTAALLTAALALALRVTGRASRVGLGLEIGAAVVLGSAFGRLDLNDLGWLVLLLTGVAVLLTAVDADGLFASGSWRRHLGWISLGLATAGLWWGLGASGTTPLEAYVLPVAGTVLAVAALLWRYGTVDRAVRASPGAALLTAAGLSLALLPLAVTGQTGSVVRPILVAAASAVLLLGATLVRWTSPRWVFLAAAGLAGAAGLLTTGVARSLTVLSAGGPAGPVLEAWLLPATAILIAAALLLVRQDHAESRSARHRTSLVLLLVALTTLMTLEAPAFDTTGLGAGRAIGLVLLLGALHVLALRLPRVPLGRVTAWWSAGLAGVAVVAALAVGAVDPFEAVVVPLGLALVAGQLLLNRPWSPGAGRSAAAAHYWIGASLALALLPSATVAAGPGATTLGVAGLTDDAVRQLVTLALGGVLALIGARLVGRPRWTLVAWPGVLVGAAAVLVTAAGRILPLLGADPAGPDWRLEAWLAPAALLLVVTGGLVIRAIPATPGTSTDAGTSVPRGVGYGLVLLALLGVLGTETAALSYPPYAIGRVLGLIALFAALHVVLRWFDRSRAGGLLAWFTIAAGALALVAGLGRDLVSPIELGTVTLGVSLVAGQLIAARMLGRTPAAGSPASAAGPALPAWLGVGLAVAVLPSVVEGWTGDLLRPILTLVAGGLLGVGGALLAPRPRWSALVWPGITVGAAALVLTAAGRIQTLLAETPAGPDWCLEVWLLPAALLLIAVGALVIAASPISSPRTAPVPTGTGLTAAPEAWPGEPRRALGYGLVLLALFGILAAETAALAYPSYAEGRMIGLIALFTVLHVVVRWFDRSAAGAVLAWCTIAAGLLAVLLGRRLGLPGPLEIGTVPLGLALVAGQLIAIGLLGGAVRPGAGSGSAVAPASSRLVGQVWLAIGLAVAVLPSVLEGADGAGGAQGALLRPVLGLCVGGALGILGALMLTRARWNVLAWPACLVGILAVLLTGALQIVPLYAGPTGPSGELEAWLIPAALLLVATGAGLVWTTWVSASAAGAPTGPDRAVWAGYGLVIVALAGVVLAELPALDWAPLATIRVVLVVWLFSALYLGLFWADESRLGRIVAWVAIGGAAVMVVAGWAHDVPDPVEIVSVPLALALLASGLLQLDRIPAARSWITLAPGLLVLLLPSLVLDLTSSPIWRVVGLGVVAIAVLILGTVRRLQAPFLIGAAVLLVHALAQLWPWISVAYQVVPWWLWLGVGGVLLIVLAARYEQRIQNLKTVALRISALR